MPDSLKSAFVELTKQNTFVLANPREKFQVGDVVVDPKLPSRRLIFAGRCRDVLFIHYERGGRARTTYLVAFRSDRERKLDFLGGWSVIPIAADVAELQNAVIGAPFTTDPRCCW